MKNRVGTCASIPALRFYCSVLQGKGVKETIIGWARITFAHLTQIISIAFKAFIKSSITFREILINTGRVQGIHFTVAKKNK